MIAKQKKYKYPSKRKEYQEIYNKHYNELKKTENKFTPLITGSPEYGKEYYEFNKERIKYYNYCKENNIVYKKRGRPPHWRVEKTKESLQVKKGKFLITF